MKVLWFTNTYLPQGPGDVAELRGTGGWMGALVEAVKERGGVELSVAAARPVKRIESYTADGVRCFVVPCRGRERPRDERQALDACCQVIDEVQPDLVHVHGTERFYGLLAARQMVSCPTVISLQGLLGPCSEWYRYFGNRGLWDVVRMHRWLEIPVGRGQLFAFWALRKKARREREIIEGNRSFLGRTAWDRAVVGAMNPRAQYYHVGELLRDAFWQRRWSLAQVRRHRIIFTNAGHPRKGTEVLLDALALLQPDYPDIQVCIAGYISPRSGYGRYLRRRTARFGDRVVELGMLNAREMAAELAASHVFVSPSYIDNSPNAVCEAQLVGLPVIATHTGGVPSLVEEGHTGLFFPTGDAPTLAARLREVFDDDHVATRLGAQAHEAAAARHDPGEVVNQLLAAYEDVARARAGDACLVEASP